MKIVKYPDNSSYVEEELNIKDSKFNDIIFRLNNYESLWHLNQYVDVCNNLGVRPNITIPCLIDAQADRRFAKNQSSGLKLVCKFLNKMKANFTIFHPHNAEVVEALMNNVTIKNNKGFISYVLPGIKNHDKITYPDINHDEFAGSKDYYRDGRIDKNLVILLPDGGAYKWGVKLMDSLEWEGDILAASKNREYKDGTSILKQKLPNYNYKGKNILIIDDICINGGTFKGLAKLLREQNCGKLYLAVSHLTIQHFEKEDNVFSYFDQVFTTNSKYDEYFIRDSEAGGKQINNLQIIELFYRWGWFFRCYR